MQVSSELQQVLLDRQAQREKCKRLELALEEAKLQAASLQARAQASAQRAERADAELGRVLAAAETWDAQHTRDAILAQLSEQKANEHWQECERALTGFRVWICPVRYRRPVQAVPVPRCLALKRGKPSVPVTDVACGADITGEFHAQAELEEQQAVVGTVEAQIEAAEACSEALQGRMERAVEEVQRLHMRAEGLQGAQPRGHLAPAHCKFFVRLCTAS